MADWTEEQLIQKSITDFMDRCVPNAGQGGPEWTAVNPVPSKSRAAAGKSKAMGLKKSWPDIALIWRGRPVLVEVKRPGAPVPRDQRELHERLTAAGALVHVVRSLDEYAHLISTLGIPMRGRMAA